MALEVDAVKMLDSSLFGGRACLYIPSRTDWSNGLEGSRSIP
jgi:hypothetical protein